MLYIGSHISAAKGYAAMGKQALKLGANTFAFFTRNPRGGKAKEIDQTDVDKFLQIAEEHAFGRLVAHAPYTMNACAANGLSAMDHSALCRAVEIMSAHEIAKA